MVLIKLINVCKVFIDIQAVPKVKDCGLLRLIVVVIHHSMRLTV